MKTPLPTRKLPPAPDLDQLKHQAKDLLKAYHAGEPAARDEVATFYRDPDPAAFALHDAQLVLARSYGYDSWPKLKSVVDGVTVKRLIAAVRANERSNSATMPRSTRAATRATSTDTVPEYRRSTDPGATCASS